MDNNNSNSDNEGEGSNKIYFFENDTLKYHYFNKDSIVIPDFTDHEYDKTFNSNNQIIYYENKLVFDGSYKFNYKLSENNILLFNSTFNYYYFTPYVKICDNLDNITSNNNNNNNNNSSNNENNNNNNNRNNNNNTQKIPESLIKSTNFNGNSLFYIDILELVTIILNSKEDYNTLGLDEYNNFLVIDLYHDGFKFEETKSALGVYICLYTPQLQYSKKSRYRFLITVIEKRMDSLTNQKYSRKDYIQHTNSCVQSNQDFYSNWVNTFPVTYVSIVSSSVKTPERALTLVQNSQHDQYALFCEDDTDQIDSVPKWTVFLNRKMNIFLQSATDPIHLLYLGIMKTLVKNLLSLFNVEQRDQLHLIFQTHPTVEGKNLKKAISKNKSLKAYEQKILVLTLSKGIMLSFRPIVKGFISTKKLILFIMLDNQNEILELAKLIKDHQDSYYRWFVSYKEHLKSNSNNNNANTNTNEVNNNTNDDNSGDDNSGDENNGDDNNTIISEEEKEKKRLEKLYGNVFPNHHLLSHLIEDIQLFGHPNKSSIINVNPMEGLHQVFTNKEEGISNGVSREKTFLSFTVKKKNLELNSKSHSDKYDGCIVVLEYISNQKLFEKKVFEFPTDFIALVIGNGGGGVTDFNEHLQSADNNSEDGIDCSYHNNPHREANNGPIEYGNIKKIYIFEYENHPTEIFLEILPYKAINTDSVEFLSKCNIQFDHRIDINTDELKYRLQINILKYLKLYCKSNTTKYVNAQDIRNRVYIWETGDKYMIIDNKNEIETN
ncbi:hypothetical protein PPL_00159 [Heterostelium album PN500]|uniref:Uncharacterized protein n=1 Tax=Heterostelium pallidum (strain ATCC 26659 / Pp 5 / PN500) TaxID=670386 RepID=D3AVP4_HETP5|nr:hypothetical protein PPL_00159 [Heterostelium album PN500]EFA86367.1 hypothetical protein PPL_00159 [Heterostelium album PN500]|eukprot:XP_020438472.1 hypothetical protein PPL_00159 [Heterostelium album PN500]